MFKSILPSLGDCSLPVYRRVNVVKFQPVCKSFIVIIIKLVIDLCIAWCQERWFAGFADRWCTDPLALLATGSRPQIRVIPNVNPPCPRTRIVPLPGPRHPTSPPPPPLRDIPSARGREEDSNNLASAFSMVLWPLLMTTLCCFCHY